LLLLATALHRPAVLCVHISMDELDWQELLVPFVACFSLATG
jgi:hypothetical protein